eukprot:scaffold287405_cov24-Tisochrysis_lutea.AAC.1
MPSMLTLGGLAPALPDGCELPVTPLLTHLGRTLAAVSLLVALDQGLIRPAVDKRTAKVRGLGETGERRRAGRGKGWKRTAKREA